MIRRPRREPEEGEYQDPLKSDPPRRFSEELERSLTQDPASVMETRPVVTVEPDAPIGEAVKTMDAMRVSSLVVCEAGKPVGIFTEYDVLMRVAERYDQLAHRPVREVMTREPVVVQESEPPARVLNLMVSGPFRHLPVVDVDGKLVGVIGPRRVVAYLQRFFGDLDEA